MSTLDFRRALILTAVALRDEKLFWKICKTSNLRNLTTADAEVVQSILADIDGLFGYVRAEEPTLIADEIENCIAFLYRNVE